MTQQNKNIEVTNLEHFKKQYNEIVTNLIKFRNDSGLTQDSVANWLGVTRKKIVEFENMQRFDVELLCLYCDKYSIELKLTFEIN